MYMVQRHHKKDMLSEDDLDVILSYLKSDHIEIDEKIGIFKQIAEHLVLSSDQLGDICDLIDDSSWFTNIYLTGVGRIHDV